MLHMQNCPTGFRLYTIKGKRYCGRPASNDSSCAPVGFSTNGISYSQICGRVEGYAKGNPNEKFITTILTLLTLMV